MYVCADSMIQKHLFDKENTPSIYLFIGSKPNSYEIETSTVDIEH